MTISQLVQDHRQYLIDARRALHQIPEEAFEEEQTSRYLWRALEAMEPDRLEHMAGTGIRAVFGQGSRDALAVRADMDALPVQEDTGLPFASRHKGVMHACGHDGHMAMALTAAKIVSEGRKRLERPFVFLFQPAEETTGGADPMIREGALKDPDVAAIYGMHLWPYVKEGMVGLRPGPLMASMADINVHVEGRSSHGAKPQDGRDALVAAAHFVAAAQSIVSRNVDPFDTAILTIGRMWGGEARNIIAERAEVEGTIRTFTASTAKAMRGRVMDMCAGLERMFGVHCTCEQTMEYPPVDNARELFDAAIAVLEPSDWCEPDPVMISEDFSFYQQAIPGLFAFLGTGAPGHSESLHSPRFTFNEDVLLTGVEYYMRVTGFHEL